MPGRSQNEDPISLDPAATTTSSPSPRSGSGSSMSDTGTSSSAIPAIPSPRSGSASLGPSTTQQRKSHQQSSTGAQLQGKVPPNQQTSEGPPKLTRQPPTLGGQEQSATRLYTKEQPPSTATPSKPAEQGGPVNFHGKQQPPNRPGFGTKGREIALYTNFFPIRLPQNMDVYHYDITISPKKSPKPGKLPKWLSRRVSEIE